MFEVSIKTRFSAAHHLVGYPGACADHHGHNWDVRVFVRGSQLDDTGILVDFKSLKAAVADVLGPLDHKDLSALDAFKDMNPTSENIARYLHGELSARLNDDRCTVHRVCVNETPESEACYWAEESGS